MLICERILKKLIQHGFPARYQLVATNREFPVVALWFNELGETPEFLAALERACEIVARSFRVTVQQTGHKLVLVGDWVVRLRYGPEGNIAAATIHRDENPPPF